MADFEARVVGRLDSTELESKLSALQSREYPITLKLNTGNLKSEIAAVKSQLNSISNQTINIGTTTKGSRGGILAGVTSEYKQLQSYLKQIGQLDLKVSGLDKGKNAGQIAALANQYDVVKQKYDALMNSMKGNLSTEQWAGLASIAEQTGFRLDELKGKLEDARNALQAGISQKVDSGAISASVAAMEAQYKKLESSGVSGLENVRSELDKLAEIQGRLTDKGQADNLIQNYAEFEQVLARVGNQMRVAQSQSEKMASSLQAVQLKNQMSSWLANNSKAAANYGSSIQALISRVDQLNASGQLTAQEAQNIKQRFIELKMEATAAGEVGRSFGDTLRNSFKSMLGVVDVTQVLRTAVRYFKQMAQEVIKVDTAMTQFRIVTNGTAEDYRNFYKNTVDTAKTFGADVPDLIDSATTYARLGYNMDESSELAKYTGMLQNVGDIDVTSATNAVTAITKAYGKNADEIESVMDKMVIVGNNAPISVSELAEGLNNAGSSLAAAGNSFEQSVALLTAANTTVQNISKSSTGLRTLSARLRNTKTELDDLGETMTDAEYGDLVNALTGHGVSLTDANGNFRDTYSIMKDIAAVWDDMSSMDQAALAKTLAGTRQQNVFYGLINSFKEAENAMSLMENSAGTLSSSYDKYLDSVQGKINQFKASWTALANTILSSDFLKGAVDTGTQFIGVLDKITESIGALPMLLGGLATYFSARKDNPLG